MEELHKIRLGIIDDDRLIVQLLVPILEESGKIAVVLTAHSGQGFLEKLEAQAIQLDVILLDLRMRNGSGLDVLTQLQNGRKTMKIIVLSTFYEHSFIGQMLKIGADAFLPKEIDQEELIATIEEVHQKGHSFSTEQMQAIRKQLSPRAPKLHFPQKEGLTPREVEVLQLLCQQMTTQEIAGFLFISPKTVESHKSNLIVKTGVKNTAGLVIYAIQNQIVNPDELILIDRV
ncbi:MAG: response regulator transcription factor [Bacteroidota bacterium]